MEVDASATAAGEAATERCNSPLEKLVLEDEHQDNLDQIKVQTRNSDAMYLRQHPELSLLVNRFLQAVFEDSPSDPLSFAQDYFTQKNLEKHILGIDGEDSSSSGEEDNLVDVDKEMAKKRTQNKNSRLSDDSGFAVRRKPRPTRLALTGPLIHQQTMMRVISRLDIIMA